MRIRFVCLLLSALSCICANAQMPYEVFPTQTENDVPYRIPAIAALQDGTLICVADYRFSRKDVGIQKDGRIDLRVRVSKDNGLTWGDIQTVIEGKGGESPDFMNVAYGDPCIAADRKSGKILMMSCAGNISYPKGPKRTNVGIYYKALDKGPYTPEMIAKDWDGFYQVSDKGSAYSTMAWLSNGRLGFVMEEETHCTTAGGGYTIVFDSFSIDELTDGAYIYDSKRK